MTRDSQLARVVPVEFGGRLNGLLRQLGSSWGLVAFEAATAAGHAEAAPDRAALARRTLRFQEVVLRRHELPALHRAFSHAQRGQTRELIGLARDFATALPPHIAEVSREVGRAQLFRLRPLRDHRVVQRFIAAVQAGRVEPWHPIVFGLALAVFSMPVLQGMVVYERQSLAGYLEAASRPLGLSEPERWELLDSIPSVVGVIAGRRNGHEAHPAPTI